MQLPVGNEFGIPCMLAGNVAGYYTPFNTRSCLLNCVMRERYVHNNDNNK